MVAQLRSLALGKLAVDKGIEPRVDLVTPHH
jgi:hypothetical protein